VADQVEASGAWLPWEGGRPATVTAVHPGPVLAYTLTWEEGYKFEAGLGVEAGLGNLGSPEALTQRISASYVRARRHPGLHFETIAEPGGTASHASFLSKLQICSLGAPMARGSHRLGTRAGGGRHCRGAETIAARL
jgi:hypothetical protein